MARINNTAGSPATGLLGVTLSHRSASPSRSSAPDLDSPADASDSETVAAPVHAGRHERSSAASGTSDTTRPETIPDAARLLESASAHGLKKVDLPWEDTPEKRYPLPDPAKYTAHEKLYPPDKYGEELGPNARLFRIYHDRVTEKDEDLVQGWHETLNVLLVFAGLFSAVLTAFLMESTKQLQPDYTETTAVAVLAVLAQLQGTSSSTSTPVNPPFAATTDARWINALWFTSLMLALIVSLLAILVKQWLVQYTSLMRSSAGDAKRWACRHFALRDGLSKWGIEPFISGLAVLLHMALFLFFVGLATYLRGLDSILFYIMIAMSAATAGFYLASTVAPIIWTACPSRTPVVRQLEYGLDLLRYSTRTLLTVGWNVASYIVAVAGAVLESIFINRDFAFSWNVTWWLDDQYAEWRKKLPAWRSTTFDSRLVFGQEQQLTDEIILWVLGPENQLTDADAVVGIDAIGAVDFQNHDSEQLSPFRVAHISSAIDQRFKLLTRAEQPITAERAASIGRILRAWIVVDSPVDRDTANRLGDLRALRTHDLAILADELISHCSDKLFESPEWLTRDMVVQLAIQSAFHPYWSTPFGKTGLAIYSKHNGRDASLIKAITESKANAILVIFCLCSADDVVKALSGFSDVVSGYATMLKMLPNYLKAPSISKAWRQHLSSTFSWAFSNSGALGMVSDDERAIRLAYWSVFCRSIRTPQVDSGLLPFITSPISVQSCEEPEINAALDIIRHLHGPNDDDQHWSAGLEELTFRLLERRLVVCSHKDPPSTYQFWPPADPHNFILESMKRTPWIDIIMQDTTLNVLRQRPAAGGTTTSSWRIYLSMRNYKNQHDVSLGLQFAVALGLLSRMGLEGSRARALLGELAGDDRGTQLLLGDTSYFIQLAIHAKTIDPKWWVDMKRRILDLPPVDRTPRIYHYQIPNNRRVVEDIESAPPCKTCAELEQHIIGLLPPGPVVTWTPADSAPTVESADKMQLSTPLPLDQALPTLSLSSGYGGAFTQAVASEQQVRAITPIRAVPRLVAPSRRRTSDLEMQALGDQDGSETDV